MHCHPSTHAYAPGRTGAISRRRPSSRRGAAAVELALVLPFLAAILLGTFELGRAIIVKEILSNAARKGCRTGISPGTNDAAVDADVTAVLTSHNLDATQATILTKVNDVNVDVSTAQTGDKISVTVSIPYSSTSWLGNFFLTNQSVGSETLSMMRQ